ncbi:hypothetical protein EVAR_27572_1 [Eumeta japonica]|uniref:Uncharacterized protein n=1 Tax=Eumeta variegata TaxID=151549 RepID=A0A4C1W9W0_EUMVA|nr:hypothetical protein EVAR_27572_1 [Eumeta japonica]
MVYKDLEKHNPGYHIIKHDEDADCDKRMDDNGDAPEHVHYSNTERAVNATSCSGAQTPAPIARRVYASTHLKKLAHNGNLFRQSGATTMGILRTKAALCRNLGCGRSITAPAYGASTFSPCSIYQWYFLLNQLVTNHIRIGL